MEVEGVRLYHDQALFKEAEGGITPWHADQYYWPLSTSKTITDLIPLQATPLEMGPLEFSAGSQQVFQKLLNWFLSDYKKTPYSIINKFCSKMKAANWIKLYEKSRKH